MNLLMDDYRRGWARRCLREAKTDLAEARARRSPELAILSMKRSLTAIYYSLGEPNSVWAAIREHAEASEKDSILELLVDLERLIEERSHQVGFIGMDKLLGEADMVFRTASEVISLMEGSEGA